MHRRRNTQRLTRKGPRRRTRQERELDMLDQLEALAAPCAAILLARGQSVAVADGSTGGLIAAGMLTIPGGIKFFRGGGVLYSLKGRQILFGLAPEAFAGLSPVSEPYTLLQADGIRQQFE